MLRAQGLGLHIGGQAVLEDVALSVDEGRSLAVVGASGSGKTTLLRVLAGLETSHAGRVWVAGREVTGLEPHERGMAMLSQEADLFDDLNVRQNIAFGLAATGLPRSQWEERVEVMVLRLGLVGLEHRWPHQLSGGQRRRVGLARALVVQPKVLLLDEPLVGLDDAMRLQFAILLRQQQRRFGTTVVHVTHDQQEALSSGDRLAVMQHGRVVQQGSAQEVHARPSTTQVAAFLGQTTFLDVQVLEVAAGQDHTGGARARVRVLGQELEVAAHPDLAEHPIGLSGPGRQRACLMVRPHAVQVEALAGPGTGGWRTVDVYDEVGLVQLELFCGDHLLHVVETERGNLQVRSPLGLSLLPGTTVRVRLLPEHCWLLPGAGS